MTKRAKRWHTKLLTIAFLLVTACSTEPKPGDAHGHQHSPHPSHTHQDAALRVYKDTETGEFYVPSEPTSDQPNYEPSRSLSPAQSMAAGQTRQKLPEVEESPVEGGGLFVRLTPDMGASLKATKSDDNKLVVSH